MKPWAVYIRVSTDDQALHGVSLESQVQSGRAYALARGWTVGAVFSDPGYSGASVRRPGLDQLVEALRTQVVEGVIVWRLDRLTRSLRHLLDLVDLSDASGTKLVSVTETLDTSTSAGRLMLSMLGAFGQHERESIAGRVKTAIDHVRKQGFWTGGTVPVGCQVISDGNRRKLVRGPDADLVAPLWDWVIDGAGLITCAKRLTDAGVPALARASSKTPPGWTPMKVWRLLRSHLVTGILVDPATQARACALLDKRQTPVRPAEPGHEPAARAQEPTILAGLLRCPHCGSCYVQASVKNRHGTIYRYLRCSLANKGRILCKAKELRLDDAERKVIGAVINAIQGPLYRDQLLDELDRSKREAGRTKAERLRLLSERDQLEGRIAHLARTGKIGTTAFDAAMAVLGGDLDTLSRRLAELEGVAAVAAVDELNLTTAIDDLREHASALPTLDRQTQARVLREWVQRVEITEERIQLDLYTPEKADPRSRGPGVCTDGANGGDMGI